MMSGKSICTWCFIWLVGLTVFSPAQGQTRSVSFQDCGSPGANVTAVKLTPCTTDPCVLYRGTTVTGETDFVSLIDTTTATMKATMFIYGVPFNIPLDQSNVCETILNCPLLAQHWYTMIGTAHISSMKFPLYVPVTMQAQMFGDDGTPIFCYRFKLVTW